MDTKARKIYSDRNPEQLLWIEYQHRSSAHRAGKRWCRDNGKTEYCIMKVSGGFALVVDDKTAQFNFWNYPATIDRYTVAQD